MHALSMSQFAHYSAIQKVNVAITLSYVLETLGKLTIAKVQGIIQNMYVSEIEYIMRQNFIALGMTSLI